MINNIRDFVQGNFNLVRERFTLLPEHYKEQAAFRAYLCIECLRNGKCLVCGCSTPGMFFSPNKRDKKDRWAPFITNSRDWKLYKADNDQYQDFLSVLSKANLRISDPNFFSLLAELDDLRDEQRTEDIKGHKHSTAQGNSDSEESDRLSGVQSEHPGVPE